MPSALELVFINETATPIETISIQERLKLVFARLRHADKAEFRLHQPDPVGRLVTEIVFVGDKKIQALNAQFRGFDKPTDVLSFERGSDNPDHPASVVVSVETANRQAKRAGISLTDEVSMLASHGLLHVLGYSHK